MEIKFKQKEIEKIITDYVRGSLGQVILDDKVVRSESSYTDIIIVVEDKPEDHEPENPTEMGKDYHG